MHLCVVVQYLTRTILSVRKFFKKLWLVGRAVFCLGEALLDVSFLSFGSYSAHFLDFKLDSAQTES